MDIVDDIMQLARLLQPLSTATPKLSIEDLKDGCWDARVAIDAVTAYAIKRTKEEALAVLRDTLVKHHQDHMRRLQTALKKHRPQHLRLVASYKEGA